MSEVTGPSEINSILQNVQQNIQGFQQQENPTSAETKQFIQSMQEAASGLSDAAGEKMSAKVYDKIDGKTLAGVTQALSQLGMSPPTRSGERINWGNILMSLEDLVKKMDERKKDARLLRKGTKVEKYEVVEFLNSTEKEFTRIIKLIKDRDADEEALIQFILELLRKMEVLGAILEMAKTRKFSLKFDSDHILHLRKYIGQLQRNEEIKQFVYETGSRGEAGNTHLRFWKALKEFRALINEMENFSR